MKGVSLKYASMSNLQMISKVVFFELIVIARFRKNSVLSKDPTRDVLPASVDPGLVFVTQGWPTAQMLAQTPHFIPKGSNFHAIDLILKSEDGKDVWALQVHVAEHKRCATKKGGSNRLTTLTFCT